MSMVLINMLYFIDGRSTSKYVLIFRIARIFVCFASNQMDVLI